MKKIKKIFISLSAALLGTPVFAAPLGTDIGNMFVAFQPSVQSLIKLTIAVSMIMGLVLIINSIYKLAQLGEGGNQRGEGLKGPLVMFACGIALFGLMISLRTVGETMLMGSGPGDFLLPSSSGSGASTVIIVAILWFIRLVGFIALVRGFLLLNRHGQQAGGGQQGELGRGLTHIFGGVAAIHIDFTAKVLANTFAPGVSFPI